MTKEKKPFLPLTSKNVCRIYELLHNNDFVSFPITPDAEHTVESIVANINSKSYESPHYKTPEEKSVAYLYFLIKDHPFTDGNKRTASLAFEIVCDLNNLKPLYSGFTLDELAVFVEQMKVENHHKFIKIVSNGLFK